MVDTAKLISKARRKTQRAARRVAKTGRKFILPALTELAAGCPDDKHVAFMCLANDCAMAAGELVEALGKVHTAYDRLAAFAADRVAGP